MNEQMKKELLPTLEEAFESLLADRLDLRETTLHAYRNAFKRIPEEIRSKRLDEIKFSELKRMYITFRYDKGYKPQSISLMSSIINPIFTTAVQDDLLIKNPNDGALKAAAKGEAWKKTRRTAVTQRDQKIFMQFIHTSERFFKWENFFVFMFGSGCRVGEAIGLTWDNVDFEKGIITIDHTLEYLKGQFVTNPPKSAAGYRKIPMLKDVKIALQKELILSQIGRPQIEAENNYVFQSSRGTPIHPSMVNAIIKEIVKANNLAHPDLSIGDFSIHQTRHSFASRLVENNVNIKVIQEVLGHADFSTTMDVYAEVSDKIKAEEIAKLDLENKIDT